MCLSYVLTPTQEDIRLDNREGSQISFIARYPFIGFKLQDEKGSALKRIQFTFTDELSHSNCCHYITKIGFKLTEKPTLNPTEEGLDILDSQVTSQMVPRIFSQREDEFLSQTTVPETFMNVNKSFTPPSSQVGLSFLQSNNSKPLTQMLLPDVNITDNDYTFLNSFIQPPKLVDKEVDATEFKLNKSNDTFDFSHESDANLREYIKNKLNDANFVATVKRIDKLLNH